MSAIKLFKMSDDVICVLSKKRKYAWNQEFNIQAWTYNTALKVAFGGKVGEISLY